MEVCDNVGDTRGRATIEGFECADCDQIVFPFLESDEQTGVAVALRLDPHLDGLVGAVDADDVSDDRTRFEKSRMEGLGTGATNGLFLHIMRGLGPFIGALWWAAS